MVRKKGPVNFGGPALLYAKSLLEGVILGPRSSS